VITQDVPDDALALARGQQVRRDGWAQRFREMKLRHRKPKGG
jgi:bifunctional UDP-N-acetylglucosamine pyrophosphorylase/glucosamine-1-phosphate N-acetyltransferase